MKEKILFLVNNDVGLFNFRKELVITLLDEGYDVVIASPYGDRIKYFKDIGCYYIETPLNRHGKNPFNDLKLLNTYMKIIDEISPKCVLTYTIKPNIYGAIACKRKNIPCISNITGLGTAVENKSILQLITVSLYKYAFRDINTVFFQNKENLNFFLSKKIGNTKNYKILPGSGVNLDNFKYENYPLGGSIKFVFISRIMKEKGIDLYLEAAKNLMQRYDNLEFHVCGFCEEDYEEMLNDFQRNGIIQYHGMVKDIKPLLKQMNCTVHPTYYPEGLSNVLLESSAIGRPIIATDRSGCREVIIEGENGFLIDENDLGSLIEKIEAFIVLPESTKRQMGENGRKFVEQSFDRNIVINEYMNQINSIG